MKTIKHWEEKIKEKRKNTSYRDFLREIASWKALNFYKNKGIVSVYPPTERIKNICSFEDFENKREDLIQSGKVYDFAKNFFSNFQENYENIAFAGLWEYLPSENTFYSDNVGAVKNTYLSSVVSSASENVFYSFVVRKESRNIFNSVMVINGSQNIFMSFFIAESSNIFYSKFISSSSHIWFSSNLSGCHECLFCKNLDNKNYCIENDQYSEEEYFFRKKEILKKKSRFLEFYESITDIGLNKGSNEVSGSAIVNSENVENGYYSNGIKNGKNVVFVGGGEEIEDIADFIAGLESSDIYACCGAFGNNIYCSLNCSGAHIYYCQYLENCSFCFGCIGLKNKSFCILNKQYSKEEWYELVDKIFTQMEKDGILGEFFPGSLNPFYFNDTVASMLGDFTKEEVEKEGFMWRDEKIKVDIPEGVDIVYVNPPVLSDIPLNKGDSQSGAEAGGLLSDYQGFDADGNWKINPEILKKVIVDTEGNYYKIIKPEYDFLMKYGLPLPELHWLERIKMGFKI